VDEDPRIAEIAEALPGANCGGCGVPGCGAFAEGVVSGTMDVNGCPVATPDQVEEIAHIMGVDADSGEKLIARIMCQGGISETAVKGDYIGASTCSSAHLGGGGDKLCSYSCLGYGDCVKACPFDAMYMDEDGLPRIIDEKCTGCGNCVDPCPRDIVQMFPRSNKLFVACMNQDDGRYSRSVCTKVCYACNLCVKNAPEGSMVMENNLARVVDYDIYGKELELPTEKCQTGALVLAGENSKYYSSMEDLPESMKKEAGAAVS
jgi:Na+-translocating ferredoxin:NAD+ oxidoreductase RNF subunit RnfB